MERLSVVRGPTEIEERKHELMTHFLLYLEASSRTKFPFAILEEARDFVVTFAQEFGVPADETTEYPRSHLEYKHALSSRLSYIFEHIREYNPTQLEAALDELENWFTEDRVQSTPTEKTTRQHRRRIGLTVAAILGLGISIAGPTFCPADSTPAQLVPQKSPQAPR